MFFLTGNSWLSYFSFGDGFVCATLAGIFRAATSRQCRHHLESLSSISKADARTNDYPGEREVQVQIAPGLQGFAVE